MVTSVQDAVAKVTTAIKNRRCLPFIGAGVSAWHECDLERNWDGLVKLIAADQATSAERAVAKVTKAAQELGLFTNSSGTTQLAGAPPGRFLEACLLSLLEPATAVRLNDSHYPFSTIAQHVYEKNPSALADLLYAFFVKAYPSGALTPNSLHQKIALLPFEIIATTNYDHCFEAAKSAAGVTMHVRASDADIQNHGLGQPTLLKIHGQFAEYAQRAHTHASQHDGGGAFGHFSNEEYARDFVDRVILTDHHYWMFPGLPISPNTQPPHGHHRRLLLQYLHVLLATHRALFLGYSLRDFNITELLHGLSHFGNSKDEPIVVVRTANSAETVLWESRGFLVVECPLDVFLNRIWDELYEVPIESLSEQVPIGLGGDRRLDIPVAILLRQVEMEPDVRKELCKTLMLRFFPADLLLKRLGWPKKRLDLFMRMKWVRFINRAATNDGDRFLEFDPEVRLNLAARLKMIR